MSDWISTSTPENRLIARVLHRKLAKPEDCSAEAGTRTPTGVLPLRPERSASANSATSARARLKYTDGAREGTNWGARFTAAGREEPGLAPALGITVLFGVVTLLATVYTARQSTL